jgi:transposase
VPDNLRSGVKRACRYEPEPNATYADMAAHYGTAVLPARPYRPKDKAKAEVAVQIVERWILARLRHQTFFSLAELNKAISALLLELNSRPFQRLPGNRREAFEQLDRPALRPLPTAPYVYADWKCARPGIDYHVEVFGHLYSVPHRFVGKVVDVRATDVTVEILHGGRRIACHARRHGRGFSTVAEHLPERHRRHQQWTPGRFLNWATDIGPQTLAVTKHLLYRRPHPEHGYRACLGLLNLARRYSHARLEAACHRAQLLGSPSYHSISAILERRLDEQPLPESLRADGAEVADSERRETPHRNVRGPGYYH